MKKYCFLIGGTGNLFFQIVKSEEGKCEIIYNDILLKKFIRKILKQTVHRNIYKELFEIKIGGYLITPLLVVDLLLAKIFSVTIVTRLDLNKLKAKPLLKELILCGYFQDEMSVENFKNVKKLIKKNDTKNINDLCIHIRGGDFTEGSNNLLTSRLSSKYYKEALEEVKNVESIKKIKVVTDDMFYAKKNNE